VNAIVDLKGHNLKKLRGIAITTNGYLTKRILRMTERMARVLRENDMDLVFALGMDGVGETHNRIRRVRRMWENLNATVNGLVELRKIYDNIIIGIKTTILPQNIQELDRIIDYAEARGLFTIISPRILTENRYANLDLENDLQFSAEDKMRLVRFFESERFHWTYHRKMLIDYLRHGRLEKPCAAGFTYYFIRSTGVVYPCPLIDKPIGNILDTPFHELIRKPEARQFRRNIGKYPQCSICTEPGLERYALPCEGFTYAGLLLKMSPNEFESFHTHMGMDKYI
jgi:MoaA/NifB/PqqE/SkfB family radical SAM enzyme